MELINENGKKSNPDLRNYKEVLLIRNKHGSKRERNGGINSITYKHKSKS
jgi:hypothetical protein